MSEINNELVTDDSSVVAPNSSPIQVPSSNSSTSVDEEARRRKIISKMWGKGNKLSHKVRELEKSANANNSDSTTHNDHEQQAPQNECSENHSSGRESQISTEDTSNSINMNKPLAVVKPIILVKSDLTTTSNNSGTSSTNTTTVNERPSSSSSKTTTKTKKSHKSEETKKKKKSRSKSKERSRSKHRHRNKSNESTSKKPTSKSSNGNQNHKSSRHPSSSITSLHIESRRSLSKDNHQTSSRSRNDETSVVSPKNRPRSPSKSKTKTDHHRDSSPRTLSRSPSRSHRSPPSEKNNRPSSTNSKSTISNHKSNNKTSSSYSNHPSAETNGDNHQSSRTKIRSNEEKSTSSSRTQKVRQESPDNDYHHHRPSASSAHKQSSSKATSHRDENRSNQRSHSRHRSRSIEEKSYRKPTEPSSSHETVNNQTRSNYDRDSMKVEDNSHREKKSSRGSSIPPVDDRHRRRSSSDSHRYHRRESSSSYDRRNDHHHRHHRTPSSHSYYSSTHHVYHHHHHYRSSPSRYHHYHRRSVSPRSRHHRSRYFSSSSSSLSFSPRRRTPSRSSSSRSSSSYSYISRTSSSSRSRSRNDHYYHQKKFRRSPTLEKLFLKASESIESVSTQKNPLPLTSSSSAQLIPIRTSTSLTDTNAFYTGNFSGFSAPPPPFMSQPPPPPPLPPQQQQQQRFLKEITTDASMSHRPILNEVQTSLSTVEENTSTKSIQSVRTTSTKAPRVSRFSDILPVASIPITPIISDIPVETPLNYIQISENINCLPSSNRQKKLHNREVMECECTTSEYDRSCGIKACGFECLNRMLLIECGPMCPCGQWCTNRRFQRRSYAAHKLTLFKTDMKGYGLRTAAAIRKGRFLVEYVGEVIDMDELARRNKKYKRDGQTHQYVMSLIHGTVIDSTMKGNWARFINHSCEPNCVAEKWLVNGEYRMGLFAKRDLNLGEEITIDYRFETFGTSDLANEKCYCGAPTCRGTISVKSNNPTTTTTNNSNKRQTRRQTLDDDELLVYLRDDSTNEYLIPKTIDEIRQLIQVMSRTDSENIRSMELDLIRTGSQKQSELSRLFLECNGLRVLSSWMKDILIQNDQQQEEQQYSNEFQLLLIDFVHHVLPIKDRTTVIKNDLLDLVGKRLKLPLDPTARANEDEQQEINDLMESMLNHLDDPVIPKLFDLYSTWMSLKERFVIPKRKESQPSSDDYHHYHHRHHHHHHHRSKYSPDETSSRCSFSTRSSATQQKPIERSTGRRSFLARENQRTEKQLLSKDERRRLFEQQYEDEERARAAAVAAANNSESPGTQNEPPYKKQRTSDGGETIVANTPPQSQDSSTNKANARIYPDANHPHPTDQVSWIHQHLSQIPIEYIRSYMASIGESSSATDNVTQIKTGTPLPPPPRPENEAELSRIIRLPVGWSVATCPTDSSVYFYNEETMATSWIPPVATKLDLSPLSSAHVTEQHRSHHHNHSDPPLARSTMKLAKHLHRHGRNHRSHHHHHHPHLMSISNKRKRPLVSDSTSTIKEESHRLSIDEPSNENIVQTDGDEKKSEIIPEPISSMDSLAPINDQSETDIPETKSASEMKSHSDEQMICNDGNSSSSSKGNRDVLRRNISQHVHATLKPYTKRTCKQGRIVSTDDIKYLVKKFTLAVLDKEIEKAKNDGIPLSPILTDRVRLKTEVYVKKYMNKVGAVFQRHEANTVHSSSIPSTQTATLNSPTDPPLINNE